MENHPTSSSFTHKLDEFPDLNCEEEVAFDESYVADEEAQVVKEVASNNWSIEELESRLEPGQFVKNENMAYALYCEYALAKGFSIRRGKNVKFVDGSGEIKVKFFVCSCEGKKDEKRSKNRVPVYQKPSSRCDCKAQLKITRMKGGPWQVAKFDKEHTHDMYAVDQTCLLRSGRDITDEQQIVLIAMIKSGISVADSIRLLENMAQGRDKVGFIPRDAYDFIRKTKIDMKDSLGLVEYFKNKSNKEVEFYWNMEVDDDNRLMNFFFRDSRSLSDYMSFGDVLSFDTTYRTNKYELVCAPLVGINHHDNNILFGLAFMSDETEKSFEWLLRTFLESMHGKQPQMIFTDQCQAMKNAIATVFPSAHHRLCQWHTTQNTTSHFGGLKGESDLKRLWNHCMRQCETEDEFEAIWSKMVTSYDLGAKRKWFEHMYTLRHTWASVFSNQIFSAVLLATSRSEGTNAVLKNRFGNKTSTLLNCVMCYEDIQSKWRLNEKKKDTSCHHKKATILVANPLLKQASNVYTLDIFKLFENELKETMSFETPQQFSYGTTTLSRFLVKSYNEGTRCRIVEYDSKNVEIRCSCHKFETFGILCSHVLKVFDVIHMRSIPEKYIKKRWTKNAKVNMWPCENIEESWEGINVGDCSYISQLAYQNNASREWQDLIAKSKVCKEAQEVVLKYIECAKKEVNVICGNVNSKDSGPSAFLLGEDGNGLDEVIVRDPIIAKARGITNVYKRHWETKKKKGKGKAESSRRTKQKTQSSQQNEGNCPSQGTIAQQNQHFQPTLHSQFQEFFSNGTFNHDSPNGMGHNWFG